VGNFNNMPSGVYQHKLRTEDIKRKISKTLRGRHLSPKTEFIKGQVSLRKGSHHSEESKKKISKNNKGKIHGYKFPKGEKHPFWNGGSSFIPYTVEWTETLRRSIRERDHYTCQLCFALQSDITFEIHHIDYHKENCDTDNLITLCKKCHAKTNRWRKDYTNYFMWRMRIGG